MSSDRKDKFTLIRMHLEATRESMRNDTFFVDQLDQAQSFLQHIEGALFDIQRIIDCEPEGYE